MKPNSLHLLVAASVCLLAVGAAVEAAEATGQVPSGVVLHQGTLYRLGASGDNWRPAWAADDSQITPMCDGNWLQAKTGYHHRLYRIEGGPDRFRREDIPNYPEFASGVASWFGYGVVAVDGVLYSAVSKTPRPGWSGPFRGLKMLKSADNGKSWYRVDRHGNERFIGPRDDACDEVNREEMFFLEEAGRVHQEQEAYPFSFVDSVKQGKDNSASQDNYTEYWTVDDPKNRTYQPSLSPKWISSDGKEMVLIWSDAMENEKGDSHTVNYLWNQMKIEIELKCTF